MLDELVCNVLQHLGPVLLLYLIHQYIPLGPLKWSTATLKELLESPHMRVPSEPWGSWHVLIDLQQKVPGGIIIRCANDFTWLLSVWRSRSKKAFIHQGFTLFHHTDFKRSVVQFLASPKYLFIFIFLHIFKCLCHSRMQAWHTKPYQKQKATYKSETSCPHRHDGNQKHVQKQDTHNNTLISFLTQRLQELRNMRR